jgi:ABC-type branched-subunit amino acid transport system substrate-binding protein
MARPLRHVSGLLLIASIAGAIPLVAQFGAKNGEWRVYGGEEGSTRYSPLDQINRDNVKDLKIAWTWKSDNFGPQPEFKSETTPLMVKRSECSEDRKSGRSRAAACDEDIVVCG